MATNISDIIKNSENMSATELGGSLLQRQEEQKEDLYNRSKRSNKVDKTLALVLAGQSIFSGAYKKREKELAEAQAWELKGNKNQAVQINNISRLVQTITPDFLKTTADLSAEERAKKLLSNNKTRQTFIQHLTPVINSTLSLQYGKQEVADMQNTGGYASQVNSIINTVAREMLTKDENGIIRSENFINELPNLFKERDFDRLELLEKGINLKEPELTSYERESYKQMREKYRAQGNIVGGIKAVFRRLSGKAEDEGSINIFKKLEDLDLSNPKLGRILETLDLKGFATRGAEDSIVAVAASKNYRGDALKEKNAELRSSILTTLQGMRSTIEGSDTGDTIIGSQGLFTIASDEAGQDLKEDRASGRLVVEQDYMDFLNFLENPENGSALDQYLTDSAAIALRLRDDPVYAEKVYASISNDSKEIQKFTKEVAFNSEFRKKFAALYVARNGFTAGEGWGGIQYDKNDTYVSVNYEYDPEPMSVDTGQISIRLDAKTGYTPNQDYIDASQKNQQLVFEETVKNILSTNKKYNLGEKNLQAILDRLYKDMGGAPNGEDQADLVQRLLR